MILNRTSYRIFSQFFFNRIYATGFRDKYFSATQRTGRVSSIRLEKEMQVCANEHASKELDGRASVCRHLRIIKIKECMLCEK